MILRFTKKNEGISIKCYNNIKSLLLLPFHAKNFYGALFYVAEDSSIRK